MVFFYPLIALSDHHSDEVVLGSERDDHRDQRNSDPPLTHRLLKRITTISEDGGEQASNIGNIEESPSDGHPWSDVAREECSHGMQERGIRADVHWRVRRSLRQETDALALRVVRIHVMLSERMGLVGPAVSDAVVHERHVRSIAVKVRRG